MYFLMFVAHEQNKQSFTPTTSSMGSDEATINAAENAMQFIHFT